MRLSDPDGTAFELTVTGYQFPDASDPGKKYSWHMTAGQASRDGDTWTLAFPALTCDETPTLSAWLRSSAEWLEADAETSGDNKLLPAPLSFTEPNLALRALPAAEAGLLVLEIELRQEFKRLRVRGQLMQADTLRIRTSSTDLRAAADDWDTGWAPYPDGPA